jgi:hypothetical protein
MPTNSEISAFTDEQRRAWQASWSHDESAIAHTPTGHRYTMIIAAYVKRLLVTPAARFTANDQLKMLEGLASLIGTYFTADALAAIDPACDVFMSMVDEAKRANKDPKRCNESFEILTSWEVFNHLVRLNPSLLEAIKICHQRHAPAPH